MTTGLHMDSGNISEQTKRQWRYSLLVVIAVIIVVLGTYWQTAWSMVGIWWRSETFAHGFIILPITLYLIWLNRKELASVCPATNYFGVVLIVGLGFLWLLANLVDVQVIQQYSMTAMLPAAVLTVLGWRVSKIIAFPLLFLLFAVPFGEAFIQPMTNMTAVATVTAIKLTGIPVYVEGTFITLPTGQWSVVEGCSGVRYLIAAITLGCLYAYLMYRSMLRRIVFITLSIIVPIVANWLRAYMIVIIGHISDMKLATGVDHILYGWVFFGIIIGIMFFVGAFWREDHLPPDSADDNTVISTAPGDFPFYRSPFVTGVVVVAVLSIPLLIAEKIDREVIVEKNVTLTLPITDVWKIGGKPRLNWQPRYIGADKRLQARYTDNNHDVSLFVEYYLSQRQGAELINSQNLMIVQKHKVWRNIGETTHKLRVNNKDMVVRQTRLVSNERKLLIWDINWIGGHYTTNPYLAKLLEAKSRLSGGDRAASAVIIATEYKEYTMEAEKRLTRFMNEMLPGVKTMLENVETH